jgi:proteasome lid subunit RPN8/RPN11
MFEKFVFMFKKFIAKTIIKMFNLSQFEFKEVHVYDDVIESILEYCKESDPNEFMALFDGEIINKVLTIKGLIFLPMETSNEGVVLYSGMLPPTMKNWGSVHSHPGPSNLPSNADLNSFKKMGLFHMIVSQPYEMENIMTYNKYGEIISYQIVKHYL